MGVIYSVQFSAVSVTAQQDFFEYTAPSDAIVLIHSININQTSDVKDAEEEILSVLIKRGQTTTGSGGGTPTPQPMEFGMPAAGGVAKTNNTTVAINGTIGTLHADGWNVRGPYVWLPTPEIRIVLSPSQRFTVTLGTTPTDALTCNGTLYLEEIGG